MTEETLEPTRGQLERKLSQRILALYRSQLGHQPTQVSCNLVDQKLIIVLENAITPPEQLLAKNGQEGLAHQVRSELETVIQSQLKELIEKVLDVTVTDLLNDTTLETGRTGTIAILKATPKFRDVVTKSKTKPETVSSGDGGG
ncbi:DUF2294 domain-containing protein [Kamptonema sp. UHCC 0994]|uniref:DUF2294 domain-containing protein n=1 Tax=Kamptonema sp. UHCC 0994 TaxID=3031329 RepID=UPI0023BAB02F|nr:DUF2294 domain-containing protein [Kamptonema sp. UHCC 0994]MDF0556779.1 DUF2294 domain-containing protein [Kamptonema sp. UHCC 0994]